MEYKEFLGALKKHPSDIKCRCPHKGDQHHVHEYLGSTKLAENGPDRHNHRFAGVTGEAIPICDGRHIHELCTNTDFFEDHFHSVIDKTGPNIRVSDDKHVHFVESHSTINEGHKHKLEFATLIGPSPIT